MRKNDPRHLKYVNKIDHNSKKIGLFFSFFIRFRKFLNYLDHKIRAALFEEEGGGSACR